jgi:hypothetical protein
MGKIECERYHRNTGEKTIVELEYEWRRHDSKYYETEDKKTWLYLIGGSTGYESISKDDLKRAISQNRGWIACMGAKDASWETGFKAGWDKLVVPAAMLVKIMEEYEKDQEEGWYREQARALLSKLAKLGHTNEKKFIATMADHLKEVVKGSQEWIHEECPTEDDIFEDREPIRDESRE